MLVGIFRAVKLLFLIKGVIGGDFRYTSGLMGEMHGLPQKLGQHLTLYRADQSELEQYFKGLCTAGRAEDVPVGDILREIGLSPGNIKMAAQASIGQVYRVAAKDGVLAVKVKYPGVEKKIKSDFSVLKGLLWPIRFLPLKNSSLLPTLQNVKLMLLRECDYQIEAENQRRFYRLFSEDDEISVPEVITYNNRAIVSRWIEGQNLTQHPVPLDRWFIQTYFKFILKSLSGLGMVHADPHPGNFIITGDRNEKKELAVLDFGSVVVFDTEEVAAVCRLLSGSYEKEADLIDDLQVLGVSGETLDIYGAIAGDLVSILLEPLYYPGDYDFKTWRLQYKMNTLLASKGWEKPLDIPLKLLLLLRTLQGLYFYARRDSIIFSWHDALKKYLG